MGDIDRLQWLKTTKTNLSSSDLTEIHWPSDNALLELFDANSERMIVMRTAVRSVGPPPKKPIHELVEKVMTDLITNRESGAKTTEMVAYAVEHHADVVFKEFGTLDIDILLNRFMPLFGLCSYKDPMYPDGWWLLPTDQETEANDRYDAAVMEVWKPMRNYFPVIGWSIDDAFTSVGILLSDYSPEDVGA